jgi:chromosome segregation ATPase
MADANAPPTADELVALADSISEEIRQSLGSQTQTLASTLAEVRTSISEVAALLHALDEAINELMNRRATSDEEKRRLEAEIQEMNQSRIRVRDALNRLKDTYAEGLDGLQQAVQAGPQVVETNNREVKDKVNDILSQVQTALGQVGQPPVQGGSRRRRRAHTRGKRGSRRLARNRTRKGGYVWRKRSSSGRSSKRGKQGRN